MLYSVAPSFSSHYSLLFLHIFQICLYNFISNAITILYFTFLTHLSYANSFIITILSLVHHPAAAVIFINAKFSIPQFLILPRDFLIPWKEVLIKYFNSSVHVLHNLVFIIFCVTPHPVPLTTQPHWICFNSLALEKLLAPFQCSYHPKSSKYPRKRKWNAHWMNKKQSDLRLSSLPELVDLAMTVIRGSARGICSSFLCLWSSYAHIFRLIFCKIHTPFTVILFVIIFSHCHNIGSPFDANLVFLFYILYTFSLLFFFFNNWPKFCQKKIFYFI